MLKIFNKFLIILFFTLIPPLLIWFPYYFHLKEVLGIPLPSGGMGVIVSNYDGPLYLVVAKSFYNAEIIKTLFSFDLPVEYYAAHFPLYPALIYLPALIIGYPYAMLLITILSSAFCIYFFYKLISDYTTSDANAIWLTFAFSVFPARWLIVRSVGSPEPLFVGAIIASLYYFKNKNYWLAGLFGVIAQLTKSPGILLFIAYAGIIVFPKIKKLAVSNINKWEKIIKFQSYPVLLIPIALLGLFYLYKIQFNDFFAYFHSGDNIHIFFPPFQIFNYSAPWVNTHWLEEIIFIYLISTVGFLKLYNEKEYILASFVGIFLLSIFFVSHRDIMRYALPIFPFLFVAYRDTLNTKEFKLALFFILIPIYLFSLAFISNNTMPISNWTSLL